MSTDTLRIVRPMTITPAMVIATNVAEDDHPEWTIGTDYATGERCIKAHQVWESLVDGNIGNDPQSSPASWALVGATNRHKAFDRTISSQTARAGSITYQLRAGTYVTAVAALNVAGATSVRVHVVDPSYGTVYDRTIALARVPRVSSWWAWNFGERIAPTQALFEGIPSLPTADIYIELTGGSNLAVGVILAGQSRSYSLGVKYGARVGINDYSRKERNDYGDVVVVERAFAKRANLSLLLRASELDALQRLLAELRATPCLWIGSSRFESTTVYGFYRSFDLVISYYDYAECDLELEGLT